MVKKVKRQFATNLDEELIKYLKIRSLHYGVNANDLIEAFIRTEQQGKLDLVEKDGVLYFQASSIIV